VLDLQALSLRAGFDDARLMREASVSAFTRCIFPFNFMLTRSRVH